MLAAVVGSALPTSAVGQFYDGNELLRLCETSDGDYAMMYVMGVADHIAVSRWEGGLSSLICIPAGVTGAQMRDVACKALRDKPETRHLTAAGLVYEALLISWQCRP